MLGIELRFLGSRYHATPWDAHVNEGEVEWPPSPWRLLRAVIATWHAKAQTDIPEAQLVSLVEKLAAVLPVYSLPPAAGSHTRHYMPPFSGNTTKVFDTFLHVVDDAKVVVAWPDTDLEPQLAQALELLLARLGYLGRAEAWVEARMCNPEPTSLNCRPADETPGAHGERVRVLTPVSAAELSAWHGAALDERCTRALDEKRRRAREKGKPVDKLKLSAKEVASLEMQLPKRVYDALCATTDVIRKQGWNRPPGSRWVDYIRPRDQETSATPRSAGSRVAPTVARYALAGAVLPRLTDVIVEADKIRRVLLSHSDAGQVFLGRDPETGKPLSGHQHAFVLPEANGRHGHITHVTLFARMGFDDAARAAIERLRSVWQRRGHDLQLVLLGVGTPADFGGLEADKGRCPLLAVSKVWESRTPFVPTRHERRKRNGTPRRDSEGTAIGSPEHDLVRLLAEEGFPRPDRITRVSDTNLGGKRTHWLSFRTERKHGNGRRAQLHGVGFRLEFASPVRGPIAVGYGAHFGLGYFVPAE